MKVITPNFSKYSDFYKKNAIFTYDPGETIFHEGEVGKCMYVILEGEVEILVGDKKVSIMEQGDIFGDMSLIDDSPRSASVVTLTECTLAMIDGYAFKFLVEKVPGFAFDMLRVMAVRLRSMNII